MERLNRTMEISQDVGMDWAEPRQNFKPLAVGGKECVKEERKSDKTQLEGCKTKIIHLFNYSQAADYANVRRQTIYNWVERGLLNLYYGAYKGKWESKQVVPWINPAEIDALLDKDGTWLNEETIRVLSEYSDLLAHSKNVHVHYWETMGEFSSEIFVNKVLKFKFTAPDKRKLLLETIWKLSAMRQGS